MLRVYVLNCDGTPLMPCSLTRADNFLKKGKGKIVSRCPFTIKMLKMTKEYRQEITASLITNSSKVGVAAKSNDNCLYSAEVDLRQDIAKKMKRRREYRRTRRGRKTRFRKPRFLNRKSDRKFSPTLRSKLESHSREVKRVERLLPVTKWLVVREAKVEGYWKEGSLDERWLNTQRQVFERDGFKCRHCKKGKTELHAHHLKARSQGGEDTLENLVTLDKECHVKYHRGELTLKIGAHKFRGKIDTEVAILRRNLVVKSSEDIFGFQIKARRKVLGLEYSPLNDACAALNILPKNSFSVKCISKGDYQQTKGQHSQKKIPTGKLQGFRKFDKVLYAGKEYFIKGRMSSGYAILMGIEGDKVALKPIPKFDTLKRLAARKSWIISQKTTVNI